MKLRHVFAKQKVQINSLQNQKPDLFRDSLASRASGILSFSLKAKTGEAHAAGERFLDALGLFVRLVNIGDAKSLATHPAPTTQPCRFGAGISALMWIDRASIHVLQQQIGKGMGIFPAIA